MDENNIPDYSALRNVGSKLSDILSPNSLVIVESTIEPGFIEDDMVSLISKSGKLQVEKNFLLAYVLKMLILVKSYMILQIFHDWLVE